MSYWFIPLDWDRHHYPSNEAANRHFNGGKEVDDYLTQRFADDLEQVAQGKYDHWKENHHGALAFIILCNQFARNIFRGKAKAFAFDERSLKLAKQIVDDHERFNRYRYFEKQFILLPLMHSERLKDLQKCLEVIAQVKQDAEWKGLDHVGEHYARFYKFGL